MFLLLYFLLLTFLTLLTLFSLMLSLTLLSLLTLLALLQLLYEAVLSNRVTFVGLFFSFRIISSQFFPFPPTLAGRLEQLMSLCWAILDCSGLYRIVPGSTRLPLLTRLSLLCTMCEHEYPFLIAWASLSCKILHMGAL